MLPGQEKNKYLLAFCGTRGGLLNVALPHYGIIPSDAASRVLEFLPEHYETDKLDTSVMDRAA